MKSNILRNTGKSESNGKRSHKFITLCYDHHPEQREFVFAIKGRPFSMLSTQKLPTPTSTLIDHNLVKELGLKMEDIQCSKFTFAGHNRRAYKQGCPLNTRSLPLSDSPVSTIFSDYATDQVGCKSLDHNRLFYPPLNCF